MTLFLLLCLLTTIGLVVAVAAGRIGGGMAPAASGRPFVGLPPDAVVPADVDAVRFSLGLRGYRTDEVDAVLDRLREELRERDEELAAWRAGDDL
ncbi:DivIVA domain-containing protein [Kineococcus gynurae]|uniref:DivIVA domain-containing protein n=1 Tax=Kineococcus gynurae TaxID=452979 RepID=A0ABV5LN92_9ACTN